MDNETVGLLISGLGAAFSGGMALIVYVYMSLALMQIAKKTGTDNGWWAWIPILNVFLMIFLAGKRWWWFLLLMIPFANIVFAVLIWMAIAERRGKPGWLGILVLIPLANLILPGYLAWSK